jgi:CRISPR/Cas system-associated exonuclease Cas4 (RecB family)
MDTSADTPLNPAQQEVLALLGASPEERPRFDPGLRRELEAELEAGLEPLLDRLPAGGRLWVGKHDLAGIHGCEARHLAERSRPFEWSPATARGAVAHKAIELGLHLGGTPSALELVDEAIAALTDAGDSVGDWLAGCGPRVRAEVRAEANDRVAKFTECFPPLKPAWYPVTESRCRVELFDGRIVLAGKIDLTLGRAVGTTAGKVLIDLKTGGFAPGHVDDLRFYALLETIRLGVPPRLVATYYLDSGRAQREPVTVAVLEAAVRRTVDGAARLVALHHDGATPVLRPGTACRWCPLLESCEPGRTHLDTDEERPAGSYDD